MIDKKENDIIERKHEAPPRYDAAFKEGAIRLVTQEVRPIPLLQNNIASVLMTMNPESAESIQERISALQQEIIDKASCQEDYSDAAQEVLRLREQKEYALQNDT